MNLAPSSGSVWTKQTRRPAECAASGIRGDSNRPHLRPQRHVPVALEAGHKFADSRTFGRSTKTPRLNSWVAQAAATLSPSVKDDVAAVPVTLPPSLKNNVAILEASNPAAPGGKSKVYVLGMSHVSKVSCQQIKDLIKLVQPEVVLLELCKERFALLADLEEQARAPDTWHSRKVVIEGLPEGPEWPKEDELKKLLKARLGAPVSITDVETDVRSLLSTGLFKKVAPSFQAPSRDDAPEFIVGRGDDTEAAVTLVPPVNQIKYIVTPRVLPPISEIKAREDSSLKGLLSLQDKLDEICATALEQNKEGKDTLEVLLQARADICAAYGTPVAVAFSGADTGRLEVLVKTVKANDLPFTSGLESSAVRGEGVGIDRFVPNRKTVPLLPNLFLPSSAMENLTERLSSNALATAAGPSSQASRFQPRTSYRAWTPEEMQTEPPSIAPQPAADFVSRLLTGTYGKIQAKAGFKAGISRGAAWRAALEAASQTGVQQVWLADRPSDVTARKLADNIFSSVGSRLLVAIALITAAVAASTTHVLPESADTGVIAAALLSTVAVMWPIAAPLLEVSQFADLSGKEIEDIVALKEPITAGDLSQPLKVYGEDALLDWPGAMEPIIRERDTFMAKAAAAAATGSAGVAPAFVLDSVDGKLVWRYMMAEGAPAAAAPVGQGDGAYKVLPDAQNIVAVVGTAHVRGMVAQWGEALEDTSLDNLVTV